MKMFIFALALAAAVPGSAASQHMTGTEAFTPQQLAILKPVADRCLKDTFEDMKAESVDGRYNDQSEEQLQAELIQRAHACVEKWKTKHPKLNLEPAPVITRPL